MATPVKNFLLFDYELIRGTASDGQMSGGNSIRRRPCRSFRARR